MHKRGLPLCARDTDIKDVIQIVSEGKVGLVVVLDGSRIAGVITDGDIRRAMENSSEEFFSNCSERYYDQKNPKMIAPY